MSDSQPRMVVRVDHSKRVRALAVIAGWVAIVSALPYLALKGIWLTGGTLGVADRSLMRESTMMALNATTAAMDVAGISLALAFTYRWGLRIPAWLVLPPMWVATGLLARFVIAVPIVGILAALAPDSAPRVVAGPVEPWVYVLVYIEFAGLGAGLTTAFVLYANKRWPEVLQPTRGKLQPGPTRGVHVALTNATACVAISLALLHVAWALGASVGLTDEAAKGRTTFGSAINAVDAALMMAAAIGMIGIVHRVGEAMSQWLLVSMAWTGTASLFGWGLWQTINVVGQTALMPDAGGRVFVNFIGLVRLIVGLIMGLSFLLLAAQRREFSDAQVDLGTP